MASKIKTKSIQLTRRNGTALSKLGVLFVLVIAHELAQAAAEAGSGPVSDEDILSHLQASPGEVDELLTVVEGSYPELVGQLYESTVAADMVDAVADPAAALAALQESGYLSEEEALRLSNALKSLESGGLGSTDSLQVAQAEQVATPSVMDAPAPPMVEGALTAEANEDLNALPATGVGPLAGFVISPLLGGSAAVAVLGTAVAAKDGSSSSAVASSSPLVGKVIDGYVSGATVKVYSADGTVLYTTTTDASGAFSIPAGIRGSMIASGGTNLDTGLPNLMEMKAPAGATVLTPLTTLVSSYMAKHPNASVADASAAVSTALGLPAGHDLTSYDAYANAGTADGLAIQKKAAMIAEIITDASQHPAAGVSAVEAAKAIMAKLADLVGSSTPINLTSAPVLDNILAGSSSLASEHFQSTLTAINGAESIASIASQQSTEFLPNTTLSGIQALGLQSVHFNASTGTIAIDAGTAVNFAALPSITTGGATVTVTNLANSQVHDLAVAIASGKFNGSVTSFDLSSNAITLSVADAASLVAANVKFAASDVVGVQASGAQLGISMSDLQKLGVEAVSFVGELENAHIAAGATVDFANLPDISGAAHVTLDGVSNAQVADLVRTINAGNFNGTIDTLDLGSNALSLSEADAATLIDAQLSFAANDVIGVQAASAQMGISLSDLQQLGVDAVNFAGSPANAHITAGAAVDFAALPTVTGAAHVILDHVSNAQVADLVRAANEGRYNGAISTLDLDSNAITLSDADAAALAAAHVNLAANDVVGVQASGAQLGISMSDLQKLGVVTVSFVGEPENAHIAAGATVDFANLPDISGADQVTLDGVSNAQVADLVRTVNAGNFNGTIDTLDLGSNALNLSEADAASLIDARLSFVANDVIGVQAASAQMGVSMSDLQQLGVDAVSFLRNPANAHITAGAAVDFAALPTVTGAAHVVLEHVSNAQVADLVRAANEGRYNGAISTLDLDSNAITLTDADAAALAAAHVNFAASDVVEVQATGDQLSTSMSDLQQLGVETVSFVGEPENAHIAAGATVDFANLPTVSGADQVTLDGVSNAQFADLLGAVKGEQFNGVIDTLDLTSNELSLSEADAATLIDAQLSFAANDVIGVQAASAQMGVSMSDLQQLGVDTVNFVGEPANAHITAGAAVDFAALPTVTGAAHVVLEHVSNAQVADLVLAVNEGRYNGAISTLDLDSNSITLTDADAASLVSAHVNFAASDVVEVQATGDQLSTSMSDLQQLGVETVSFVGEPENAHIAAGATVDFANLPDISGADQVTLDGVSNAQFADLLGAVKGEQFNGVIDTLDLTSNELSLSEADAATLIDAQLSFAANDVIDVQAASAQMGISLSDLQQLGVDAVNFAGSPAIAHITAGAAVDFAALPTVTGAAHVVLEHVSNAQVADLVLAVNEGRYNGAISTLDLDSNSITLTDADAASLVSAHVNFAASDVVEVQATGDQLSTSMSDLQQLGVETVSFVGEPENAHIAAGATVDFANLPTVSGADQVTLDGVSNAQVADLVRTVNAGDFNGTIDTLDLTSNALNLSEADAATLIDAQLGFAANDVIGVQAAGAHMGTSMSDLQQLGVDAVSFLRNPADAHITAGAAVDFAALPTVTGATHVVLDNVSNAQVVDLVQAVDSGDFNGVIDTIDLTSNAMTLDESQAASLIGAEVDFAAQDVIQLQATGTHLSSSMSDLQKLGVDTVSFVGEPANVHIAAGAAVDFASLPSVGGAAHVVLDHVSDAQVADLVRTVNADNFNGTIDTLDLTSNELGLSEADAASLIAAHVNFAAGDTIDVQAAGDHLGISLSDLQQLGVDAVNFLGSPANAHITAGAAVDFAALPTVTGATHVVLDNVSNAQVVDLVHAVDNGNFNGVIDTIDLTSNAMTLDESQAASLIGAEVDFAAQDVIQLQATGTHLSSNMSELQKLGVDTVSFVGEPANVHIAAGAAVDFASLPSVGGAAHVVLDHVSDAQVADLVRTVNADNFNGTIDTLDLESNELGLSEADAASLIAAHVNFAAGDTIDVQAAGDHLGISLSDLQQLGVDAVNFVGSPANAHITAGAAVDFAALPTVSGATHVVLDNVSNAQVVDLVQAVDSGDFNGVIDTIDLTSNAMTLDENQAASLIGAGVDFAAQDVIQLQATGTHLSSNMSDLQKLGVDFVHTEAGEQHVVVDAGILPSTGVVNLPVFDAEDHVTVVVNDTVFRDVAHGGSAASFNLGAAHIDDVDVAVNGSLGSAGELLGTGILSKGLSLNLDVAFADHAVTLGMILDAVDGANDPLKMTVDNGGNLVEALQAAGIHGIHIDEVTNFIVTDAELKPLMDAGLLGADAGANVTVTTADSTLDVTLAQLSNIGADHVTTTDASHHINLDAGVQATNLDDLQAALNQLLDGFDDAGGNVTPIFDAADDVHLSVKGYTGAAMLDEATTAKLVLLGIDDVLDENGNSIKHV